MLYKLREMLTTSPQISLSLSLSLSHKNHRTIKKMMQPELLLPTWPNFNFTGSALDHKVLYDDQEIDLCVVDDSAFSYLFTSPEDSSIMSSNSYVTDMITDDQFFDLKVKDSCNEIQICPAMEDLDTISRADIEGICEWINEDNKENSSSPSMALTMEEENGWSPCLSSDSNHNSVFAQTDTVEVHDHQLTLIHLLRAYGEAVERGETELAAVIVSAINHRSNPLGNTTERVAYNLFQSREGQGEYLREEASKNVADAFKVLYHSLPNGRLAHFTANSAILDSVPDDARVMHIVDFDVGDGIQWPPLIEALSGKQIALRITSVRTEEECTSSRWKFEDTKKRLLSQATEYGVKLQIEQRSIEDVGSEMMRMKKRGLVREWVAFNCMVGLPHMGRRRPRTSVEGFLREAKSLLTNFGGILVLGDGEARENSGSCSSYSLCFDSLQRHYQAVFESLERNFPVYLAEARAAMESLFLAPLMCPLAWYQDWEETGKSYDFQTKMPLEGRKLSLGSLVEAKEMVVEGENSYNVRIEGMRENEMVLRWKETTLVRISAWM